MSLDDPALCGIPAESIHALLLGDLEPADAAALQSHLESCPHCRAVHQDAAALDRVFDRLPRLDCPPRLRASLRSIPRRHPARGPFRLPRTVPARRLLGVLTGLAAAAALGGFLLHRAGHAPPAVTAPPPEPASLAKVEQAERQLRAALALLEAAGRESAQRATEKVLAEGVASPARRLRLALLGGNRRAERPGPAQTAPPGTRL